MGGREGGRINKHLLCACCVPSTEETELQRHGVYICGSVSDGADGLSSICRNLRFLGPDGSAEPL